MIDRTNYGVVQSWLKGERNDKPSTRGLWTDGKRLHSYWLVIGATGKAENDHGGNEKVVFQYTAKSGGGYGFYSITTSNHVGLAGGQADRIATEDETPIQRQYGGGTFEWDGEYSELNPNRDEYGNVIAGMWTRS